MGCLLLEIGMAICGLIALITGKVNLTGSKAAQGVPARIIGVIMLLPFPLSLLVIVPITAVIVSRGQPPTDNMTLVLRLIESGIILACFLVSMVIGFMTATPVERTRRRRRRDPEDEEEDDRPRRRRREPDEDEEEDERPRRRVRARDEEEDPPPRRRPGDQRVRPRDEDDRPRRREERTRPEDREDRPRRRRQEDEEY